MSPSMEALYFGMAFGFLTSGLVMAVAVTGKIRTAREVGYEKGYRQALEDTQRAEDLSKAAESSSRHATTAGRRSGGSSRRRSSSDHSSSFTNGAALGSSFGGGGSCGGSSGGSSSGGGCDSGGM